MYLVVFYTLYLHTYIHHFFTFLLNYILLSNFSVSIDSFIRSFAALKRFCTADVRREKRVLLELEVVLREFEVVGRHTYIHTHNHTSDNDDIRRNPSVERVNTITEKLD